MEKTHFSYKKGGIGRNCFTVKVTDVDLGPLF